MPRVENITSEVLASVPCKHQVLFFGSGGYCIICANCSCMWVAKDTMSDEPDRNFKRADLTDKDVRVDPKVK